MANLESILKNRDITLPTKVHKVKVIVFPVVTYGYESWIIKEAEHRRIDAFELWSWRRLLRVPQRERRSDESILKEISPEYSLEGMMLKLQYFATWCKDLTHWKRPWCWKRLKTGGEEDDRWHHRLGGHEFQQSLGVGDGQEILCAPVHGVAKSQTQLSNWTGLIDILSWKISHGHLRKICLC